MFGQLVDLQAAGLCCLVVALVTRILHAVMHGTLMFFKVRLFGGNVKAPVAGEADKVLCVTVFFVPLEPDGGGRDVAALVAKKVIGAVGRALVQLKAVQTVHFELALVAGKYGSSARQIDGTKVFCLFRHHPQLLLLILLLLLLLLMQVLLLLLVVVQLLVMLFQLDWVDRQGVLDGEEGGPPVDEADLVGGGGSAEDQVLWRSLVLVLRLLVCVDCSGATALVQLSLCHKILDLVEILGVHMERNLHGYGPVW